MTQITVRDVGPDLHNSLKGEAKRRGMSMNQYVLAILREAAGLGNGQQHQAVEFDDLDHLAGTWSAKEAEAFEEILATQREIEPDLWP